MQIRSPLVLGVLSGVSSWFIALSVYLSPVARQSMFFVVPLTCLLMGTSIYFFLQPFLTRLGFGSRILVSTVTYLLIGAIVVPVVAAMTRYSGALVLVPFWPLGVAFMVFSERVYDPSDVVALLLALMAAVSAIGVSLHLLLRRQTGRRPKPGEVQAAKQTET